MSDDSQPLISVGLDVADQGEQRCLDIGKVLVEGGWAGSGLSRNIYYSKTAKTADLEQAFGDG